VLVLSYFFIILLGAAFGSFFNVCIYRIPAKKSLIPDSHCPGCNTKIRGYHNIPILSFIMLKAKCPNCGSKIHWHYFLVELITPILFVLVFMLAKQQFSVIFAKYIIFISFGIIIFAIDAFHKIIPNVLSYTLIIIGIIFSLIPGTDIGLKSSLLGGAAGFVIFLIIGAAVSAAVKKDALGGGDIKLIAAIGTFIGIIGNVVVIFLSSFIALFTILLTRKDLKEEFPYGPFLIIGAVFYILFGDLMLNLYRDFFDFIFNLV